MNWAAVASAIACSADQDCRLNPYGYYPKYGLKTAIFGVKAGVVVGILKVMLLVAKRRAKAFRAAGQDEATATMAAPAE